MVADLCLPWLKDEEKEEENCLYAKGSLRGWYGQRTIGGGK
jgi:hypothetical protein